MKKIVIFTVLLLVVSAGTQAKLKKKSVSSSPTVAISEVRGENITLNQNTAQSIKDLANDSCVKAGLRCLERQDLNAIRAEQNIANSDEAAPGQNRARKKSLTTADVLVSCALTGSTADAAGVGVAVRSRVLDTIGVKGVGVSTDRVTMTCRAYDTSTSEILLSQTNNKMAVATELVVFNYQSGMAKAVQKAMDKFFESLKEKLG